MLEAVMVKNWAEGQYPTMRLQLSIRSAFDPISERSRALKPVIWGKYQSDFGEAEV